MTDVPALVAGIENGERRALARLITLIESTRTDHRDFAEHALDAILPKTGKALRVGISGVPGVGKSSFIEAFGLYLTGIGKQVAVLAVDPSSPKTGGSILGDKTRMENLAKDRNAFIRPSPSGGSLGGVARRTRETILAVEAAGFDIVLIETVGVGQSEYAVADLVDMFTLLVAPGGGDDLQGIKKGIVEMADLLVVTKDDGDLQPAASRAYQDYRSALHLLNSGHGSWKPKVMRCSAHTGTGLTEVWDAMREFRDTLTETGEIATKRSDQAATWMWSEVTETLLARAKSSTSGADELEAEVRSGARTPADAARELLKKMT